MLIGLLATVTRRAWAGRRRRFKVYVLGVLAAQFVAVTALGLTAIVTDPTFLATSLNGPCARSPDGARRACLYSGGMMCGYEVWVGPSGGHVLRQAAAISKRCDEMGPGAWLRWRADGSTVEVIAANGESIGADPVQLLPQVH